MRRPIPALVLILAGTLAASAQAAGRSAAVFDFELVDTSLEGATRGPQADEQARLGQMGAALRRQLEGSGRFSITDIGPVAAEARALNLHACGACALTLSRRVGAELAVTGVVHKVSTLILSMTIAVTEAETGRPLTVATADFRGNTDESWSRALDWLVRNRLLASERGGPP
jgi:hypothetical protein